MTRSDFAGALAAATLVGVLVGFSAAIFIVPVYWEAASDRLRAAYLPLDRIAPIAAPVSTSPLHPWR